MIRCYSFLGNPDFLKKKFYNIDYSSRWTSVTLWRLSITLWLGNTRHAGPHSPRWPSWSHRAGWRPRHVRTSFRIFWNFETTTTLIMILRQSWNKGKVSFENERIVSGPVWPDLAKFRHFNMMLKHFGYF